MSDSTSATSTALGWYLEQIKHTPLLSAEEEKQLARRIQHHSDPIARQQMIQANLLLVVKIAKEYSTAGMTLGDLVAEGNLGLMRAVEEFDPDAGVRFSTYAAWWIKQSIKKALINAGQPIHIPAYLAKLLARFRRSEHELEAQLGRTPTFEEVSRHMKLSRKKAEIVQQGLQAVTTPTQVGNEDTQAVSEMLPDEDAESPDGRLLAESIGPTVQKFLSQLDERSRNILILRYGLDGAEQQTRTYKEIGEAIELTRERVRQLERQAVAQLHELFDELA
jgi:RNA polymerase primary sigma factor